MSVSSCQHPNYLVPFPLQTRTRIHSRRRPSICRVAASRHRRWQYSTMKTNAPPVCSLYSPCLSRPFRRGDRTVTSVCHLYYTSQIQSFLAKVRSFLPRRPVTLKPAHNSAQLRTTAHNCAQPLNSIK